MSMIGLLGLLTAFAATVISAICLIVGHVLGGTKDKRTAEGTITPETLADTLTYAGRVASAVGFLALTVCCGILVYCFMSGDVSIKYVLMERSNSTSGLAWLYKLSGLWAGREGSLLFWAWLISLFNTIVAFRDLKKLFVVDNMALAVLQVVLAAFVGVLLFSETNMPFTVTPSTYFTSTGALTTAASLYGMNTLLEHWAMAIHPPTLFVGYAGLSVPFAYAVSALIVDDSSSAWVKRSTRYALVSWLFLGAGIGLGAVWAYVVLGWGGYWGWDPVENASLLSWLVGVALLHSMTVYRQRGAFKRWTVMCACLTFAFVIVGTFISRSGLVQSVHAFEGDPVSLVLFLLLIVLSILVGIVGLALRWKSFGGQQGDADDFESMLSRDAAYYFNNVIMVVSAIVLAYMTISSALPSWMPFGGESLSSGTYNTLARPLGIFYLAILAICPLLSWGKTTSQDLRKRMLVPGICALVLFAGLVAWWAIALLPAYNATVAAGGTTAEAVTVYGPSAYYNGLAIVGFAVASLLVCNAVAMLTKAFKAKGKSFSLIGGSIAHVGMGIVLVGLIGSSMYVTEHSGYLAYDEATDSCAARYVAGDYELEYVSNSISPDSNGDDILYTLEFDVYKGGSYVGHVSPAVQVVQSTQQQKLCASVISYPQEDLFVVYRGVNDNGDFSLDVKVNPLVSCVWLGFALLMMGALVALVGKRR